ncbi:MAG: energy transducer TonB, partial [Alloprevotella sp.]|nr:energy transducer TonB [Alloprevotella sp.]
AIDDTDINQVWAFPAIVGPYFVLYNATGNKALCFENGSVKLADVASRQRKDFLWTRKDRQFRAMQDPSYVMAITTQGRLTAVQQSASTDVLTEFLIDPLSPDLIEPLVGKTKDVKSQERVTKSSMAIAAQDYAGAVNIDELKVDQRAGGTPVRRLEEEIVDNSIVEVPASYPGGDAAVLKFVSENLIYPIEARNAGLQGTVVLRFIIEKDGSIGQIVVRKSLSKECDQAAAQVVSKLKRFTPAEQQGHKMKVWYTLPIRFSIQ